MESLRINNLFLASIVLWSYGDQRLLFVSSADRTICHLCAGCLDSFNIDVLVIGFFVKTLTMLYREGESGHLSQNCLNPVKK